MFSIQEIVGPVMDYGDLSDDDDHGLLYLLS